MGSWAAATWRLGGSSVRGGLRAVPRRRGSSRPGGGDRAAILSDLLQSSVEAEEPGAEAARREPRSPREGTVLLFPGQGSQFVGMGRGLLQFPGVRDMYRLAEKVLGYDLLSLCLEGPQGELDRTRHCQPAVFVASLAAVEKLNHQQPKVRGGEAAPGPAGRLRGGSAWPGRPAGREDGVPGDSPGPRASLCPREVADMGLGCVSVQVVESCVAAAGYSVGEFAALVFAGALDFAEGARGTCRSP